MAFWTESTLEPLRKFRFQIQFGDRVMWWAKSVTQPSPDVSMSEYQLINHKIKYPGIVTWNDIDITIVDIGSEGSGLYSTLKDSGYSFDGSNPDGIKKNQLANVIEGTTIERDVLITKLSAEGKEIETWKLINPFIKSIRYGDLEYSSDELLEITVTMAYDSAELTNANEARLERLRERDPGDDIIDL